MYNFKTTYWGKNNSTKVTFIPSLKLPPEEENITSCMCAVFSNYKLLLVRPDRGWGLPGGHIEKNETPIDCIKRECLEEACVEIKNIKLVGYWQADKIKQNESNSKYPSTGYQLLFIADAEHIFDFKINHETTERRFLPPNKVNNVHHSFAYFENILKYIILTKKKLDE